MSWPRNVQVVSRSSPVALAARSDLTRSAQSSSEARWRPHEHRKETEHQDERDLLGDRLHQPRRGDRQRDEHDDRDDRTVPGGLERQGEHVITIGPGRHRRVLIVSEHSIAMSEGLPSTVLPELDPALRQRLAAALAEPANARRDAVAAVVADHPRVLEAWAALGRCRTRRDRALLRVSHRLPPRPRRAAGQRLARLGLRAVVCAVEPRLPAVAARAPADGRGNR